MKDTSAPMKAYRNTKERPQAFLTFALDGRIK
jgi:hypothetical protein